MQRAADDPIGFVAFVIAIVLGITVHEFMHAYAATRLGDDTARLMGRLSLNPMAHLDPFGTLLIVLAGFGYGKPVPFNESRLRSALGVRGVALESQHGIIMAHATAVIDYLQELLATRLDGYPYALRSGVQ